MSNEAKRSPGPFQTHPEGLMQIEGARRWAISIERITETGFETVAIVTDMQPRQELPARGEAQELEANGRLFAAAPDMLEALRAALGMVDALLEEKRMLAAKIAGTTTIGNHRAMIRAALVKAEGSAE